MDPSTFDFVMDAFPARTSFSNKKVSVAMTIVGGEDGDTAANHSEPVKHEPKNK